MVWTHRVHKKTPWKSHQGTANAAQVSPWTSLSIEVFCSGGISAAIKFPEEDLIPVFPNQPSGLTVFKLGPAWEDPQRIQSKRDLRSFFRVGSMVRHLRAIVFSKAVFILNMKAETFLILTLRKALSEIAMAERGLAINVVRAARPKPKHNSKALSLATTKSGVDICAVIEVSSDINFLSVSSHHLGEDLISIVCPTGSLPQLQRLPSNCDIRHKSHHPHRRSLALRCQDVSPQVSSAA